MRIPAEKEFAMKKAILKAIEAGHSPAQLAPSFGVSKSTIYKYRRMLRDQGFIKKNENDVYVITENKFSTKANNPKSGDLFEAQEAPPVVLELDLEQMKSQTQKKQIKEMKDIPTRDEMEQRLQSKIEQMRNSQQEDSQNKNLLKKFLGKFIKK